MTSKYDSLSSLRPPTLVWCAALALLCPAVASAAPGFVVRDLDAVPTEEGGEAVFTVALASAPTSPVTLDVTSSKPSEVTVVAENPVPFDQNNWNQPQRFRAIGLDDEVEDGDAGLIISVKATPGSAPAYAQLPAATLYTENLDDDTTLKFDSAYVQCNGPKVEDIHDGRIIGLIYDRKLAQQDNEKIEFDLANEIQDDRVFAENSDGTYFQLRTLHVVLPNTFRKTLTEKETLTLQQSYARAAHRIHTASRGMIELDFDQVVIPGEFGKGSFIDEKPAAGMQAKFVDFPLLKWALALSGYDWDQYDMISLSVAFADDADIMRTEVAYAVPPPKFDFSVPFTNPETWDNERTWTQVMYTTDPLSPEWIDIYVHEMNHSAEWMLEYGSFTEMRNADDGWWLLTYPDEQVVLDMFWARAKTDYFFIPPPWGTLEKRTPTHIVEMSCPDEHLYQERRVYCPNGVSCGIGCWCNKEPPPR